MDELHRRALLTGALVAGAGSVTQALAAPKSLALADIRKEADLACLYHCDFGEAPRFSQMINNIGNHYSVFGANPFEAQLCVVAHSAGVKFFLETVEGTPWAEELTVPKIFERVEAQITNGLKIYLCSITFERLKLDRNKVRKNDAIAFVPSGVATVAALQGKGFAYLKVG
jgi:intracellular sulfur oxidation DsrE/DsrF family protein